MTETAAAHQPEPEAPTPWRETVLIGVAILTPPLVYLSNVSYAVFLALPGLLALPLLFKPRRPLVGVAYLVALAAWALASMSWSPAVQAIDPLSFSPEELTGPKMLLELGLYGAFVAMALGLSRPSAVRVSLVLTAGLVALSALFLLEALLSARIYHWIRAQVGQPTGPDFAIRDVGRVAYALALLFWPAAIRLQALKGRWTGLGVALFMALAMILGAALLGADAPAAALALSAGVFFLVRWGGRRAVWACMAGAVLYFAAAPLLVHLLFPLQADQALAADRPSWSIRLDIWRFAAERILQHPFLGWGLDASRSFPTEIELHPHNAALQVWLELGAVGAALAALFWAWLFGRIERAEEHDRNMAAAAAATASVYLTIGALSFGVWQEWWMALGALAAASCAAGFIARRRPVHASTQGGEPAVDQAGVGA